MSDHTRPLLPAVVFLRAVASVSVCIFHLYCGNVRLFTQGGTLKNILSFGYLGVTVFFIISGFIICYAMPDNYRLKNFDRFLKKRIIRIEPPYLVSVLVVLAVKLAASRVTHNAVDFSFQNLLFHIGYLCNFNLGTYYNVVYWTLGLEFQFYLIIGLLFSYISQKPAALVAALILFLFTCYVPTGRSILITSYLNVFGLGILMYFYKFKNTLSLPVFILFLLLYLGELFYSNLPVFAASAFTLAVLAFWNYRNVFIDFLSRISYSLYLIHVPIGGTIINWGLHHVQSITERYLLFLAALGISIGFAYLFNLAIERPCLKYAKRITYNT